MIKIFKGDYNKVEFYSLMGAFFAETRYQQELPYLTNREKTVWYVSVKDNRVIAFGNYEESSSKIVFKADYYLDSVKDLRDIICLKLDDLKGAQKPIETATANEEIKKLYLSLGFIENKVTKNYCFLVKENLHD